MLELEKKALLAAAYRILVRPEMWRVRRYFLQRLQEVEDGTWGQQGTRKTAGEGNVIRLVAGGSGS